MRTAVLLMLALAPSCAPAGSAVPPVPPPAPREVAGIEIRARAVDISPGQLDGLRLRGTHALWAGHQAFGGFSGIAIADGRLFAVSDQGWWLEARLEDGPGGAVPVGERFAPMLDAWGMRYDKAGGDAEGLALGPDGPAISFERDHRVMVLGVDGRMGRPVQPASFATLRNNSGLEALARLPGGALLAIAEGARDDRHPMFRIAPDGTVTRHALPRSAPHAVTGADVGPDGRIYVVLRYYNPLIGVSARIHRYRLGADGLPDVASREVLAAFESASGIDNMEGIALWRDEGGRMRLALISDDNFSLIQRTLFMDFEVLD